MTIGQPWLTFLCFCVAMSRQERSWKSPKKWRFVTDPPRPERFSLWCQDAERRRAWRRRRDRRGGWGEAQVTQDTTFCPKSHPPLHCNAQFPLMPRLHIKTNYNLLFVFVLFCFWCDKILTKPGKNLRQIVDKKSANCRRIVNKLTSVFVCSQGKSNQWISQAF